METRRLVIDSSVLIAYLRGQPDSLAALRGIIANHIGFVAAISVYELLFSTARTRKPISEEKLLAPLIILPLDENCARVAARLHASLIQQNQDIGIKDVLIAATCLAHELPLVTLNQSHFSRVPSLTVITPAQV